MATIEKPKKTKTKKYKVQRIADAYSEPDETGGECSSLNVESADQRPPITLDNLDLPATQNKHTEIISHECSIASDYRNYDTSVEPHDLPHEIKKDLTTVQSVSGDTAPTNISLQDELINAEMQKNEGERDESTSSPQPWTTNFDSPPLPTAPACVTTIVGSALEPIIIAPSPVVIHYPNLSSMQHVESKANVAYQTPKVKSLTNNQLKPFTDQQMREIYMCTDLDLVKQFELEFLMNSLLDSYENDPLYVALLEYYNLQSKLTMNHHDVKRSRQEALDAQDNIWQEVPEERTFIGTCGDNVTVKESVQYNIAQVDGKNLEKATAATTQLFDLVCNTCIANLISSKITHVKIDQIINEIISYPRDSDLATTGQISLSQSLDSDTLQCMTHLRRAISILFSFIRKPSPSKEFHSDLILWLNRLVSLHLLLATKEDHWFLLFNILRCPSGVGNWATSFLQVPCEKTHSTPTNTSSGSRPSELPFQLGSPEINHCVAVLQILLLPIKKRNEYLKAFTQSQKEISDPVKEERWIVVDSDGEDSHNSNGDCVGLKESDLIALLNQIPFEKLFTSALGIEKFLNDYIIEADLITANQMLRVIAFFSKLIEIFGEGMFTYNTDRYKQLAKRLGRLIRHTLQYISDYHELFIHNNLSKDPFLCERIAVEMNSLLIKACSYIYRSRNLGTWQYFSSLLFSSMDSSTVWQMFYFLNVGFPSEFPIPHDDYVERCNDSDFWTKFNVANADSSSEDFCYLLQAFFEMANERDRVKDWDLIEAICLHIFNIGFINTPTVDVCYKAARDILINLSLSYEDLISSMLLQLKIRFNEIENSAYLFKSLPLENWKPSMSSFEILSNWLLNFDVKSAENMLARIVISHLNWGFDCDGRLFLPHNIHVRMACLITEALNKYAPELIGASSISESVRQVSNLIDFTQSTKEQFTFWCWSMVSILRLHLMDQNTDSVKKTLRNPTEPLMFVPDLERINVLFQGVTEKRPLAIYCSILVSLWGHSIPLICQKGFEQMNLLLTDHRHWVVIRCIELIVPLFLETPETLANCESFHAILNNLLNADKTYLKMAKDMIYANSIGPVLELFDNMIHHQITNYTDYGLVTPLNLINIWLNCLTSLPNWQNTSVVYLLDKILRVAYQFPDARLQTVEFFRYYYKDFDEWKGSNKTSTLKNFFGSNQTRLPVISPSQVWLALVLLEIEYKKHDEHLWPEFLRQISAANNKTDLEAVLKKTTNVMKIPSFSSQMLVIYKYANLVANMEVSHPLFPIINQKFFELYLSRVPLHYDQESIQETFGVSDKFYNHNVPLMKKIKANLMNADAFYTNMATKFANDDSLSYFYRNCSKMVKTFALWLEETSINKVFKDQQNLPPQYNKEKLSEILHGNTSNWTEFIYLPSVRKLQTQQSDQWARKCYRLKTSKQIRTPLQPKPKKTPIERIKLNLCSYDNKLNAPKYVKPDAREQKEIVKSTFTFLKSKMKTLTSTATHIHLKTCELNSLSRNYLDTVVKLYNMVSVDGFKDKSCTALLFNRKCTKPARIKTVVKVIRKDNNVDRKLESYREKYNKIIDKMLKLNVEEFAQSIDIIHGVVKVLTESHLTNSNQSDLITSTGISFFYYVINCMTEVIIKFPATHDFCSHILSELGIFIQENQEKEGLSILELTLKRPDLSKELAGVFVPYRTQPKYFLNMYAFLIDSYLKRCDTKIVFVLLSKFDMVTWLETFHPKLFDINELLKLVLRGLECWSQPDSSLLQDLFRRHLVSIFEYDFPEHYGEVMQMVLDRISDQKLMPEVLLDLLNSLLEKFNCERFTLTQSMDKIRDISEDFARRENLFSLKAATDTAMLFARHFQKERLSHGLHGLYPKHKDYCIPLSMWFSCFGDVVAVTAICTYQELLADQISDVIFGSIVDMYAPWLICYTKQNIQQPAANWIRQLTENGKMLLPWSAAHAPTSKLMIQSFINTLIFILENLPVSHKILNHTFEWYNHHFAIPQMESFIQSPIHDGIAQLPWEMFKPLPNYIDMLYDSLQSYIPESHAMLGHIFIRIKWNNWISECLPTWPAHVQSHVVSRLFTIFIKIAFEPNIHIHTNTSKILEDAINYPWYMVEYVELENLFKWFVSFVEPSIILKLPTESNYADRAVLDLLRLASGLMPERIQAFPIKHDTAKRILYTRSYVRLLRLCAAKNQKLLATKEGLSVYNAAFTELLNILDRSVKALALDKPLEVQQREALNLMIEIITPMQTQSEETSNLHIDSMIIWQETCSVANLIACATLDAIGHMKGFINGIYALLEASIAHYFKVSEETKDWHNPSWVSLFQILKLSLDKLQMMPIIQGPYFFTLHIFILYRMNRMENISEQITFLQDLSQLVVNLKTSEVTEPRLASVWGVIISYGCQLLSKSEHAKKPLLMLARNMHILSTKPESWGEGLLGAIGLKRDGITNQRKVLTRCFTCIIFSLFPDETSSTAPNQEYASALHELTTLLANKKFLNVKPLIVNAIGILNDNRSPSLRDVSHLLCRLIIIFYDNSFLLTIPEVWDYGFKLP